MKNKVTNNSTTSNMTTNTPKYKTTNGIQKLPNGTYRIRKTINGVKYSASFSKRGKAKEFLALVVTASKTA